jgi:hypothetical protein
MEGWPGARGELWIAGRRAATVSRAHGQDRRLDHACQWPRIRAGRLAQGRRLPVREASALVAPGPLMPGVTHRNRAADFSGPKGIDGQKRLSPQAGRA